MTRPAGSARMNSIWLHLLAFIRNNRSTLIWILGGQNDYMLYMEMTEYVQKNLNVLTVKFYLLTGYMFSMERWKAEAPSSRCSMPLRWAESHHVRLPRPQMELLRHSLFIVQSLCLTLSLQKSKPVGLLWNLLSCHSLNSSSSYSSTFFFVSACECLSAACVPHPLY